LLVSLCSDVLRRYPSNYIALSIITVCIGTICGFVSARYTWQSVVLSLGITVVIVFGLTIYASTTSSDFTGCGPYSFTFVLILCTFSSIVLILSLSGIHIYGLMLMFDLCGVALFSFYIVYDMQLIVGGRHQQSFTVDDYAAASLNLYFDVINLFLSVLSIADRK